MEHVLALHRRWSGTDGRSHGDRGTRSIGNRLLSSMQGERRRPRPILVALLAILVVAVTVASFKGLLSSKKVNTTRTPPVEERTVEASTATSEQQAPKAQVPESFTTGDAQDGGEKVQDVTSRNEEQEQSLILTCPESNPTCLYRNAPWQPQVYHWLSTCWQQNLEQDPFIVTEKLPNKPCPGDCNGNGVCNYELGECRCRMGYKGVDCKEDDVYPCNLNSEPNFPYGKWITSQCGAQCDTRTNKCYCGLGAKFPRRPVFFPCGFAFDQVKKEVMLSALDNRSLYDPETGFCNFDPDSGKPVPNFERCGGCNDGEEEWLCNGVIEAYCFNQCSLNGECQGGFCKCRDGFFGVDCSTPSLQSPIEALEKSTSLVGGLKEGEEVETKKVEKKGDAITIKKKRPLIYVYDMPREFTSHHLESRIGKHFCVPRAYFGENETVWTPAWLYSMENMVIEGILGSPHRTLNPEEADYFFVPLLAACIQNRADESPRMIKEYGPRFLASRTYLTAGWYREAWEHISQKFPFWNRTGGRDHIWIFPWDEGACAAPKEIWPSIMLSHWGNTMSKHNYSTTAYLADTWQRIPDSFRGNHPCFDPLKDVVMPAFKVPTKTFLSNRYWERPAEERNLLFYFNGNLGRMYGGRPEPDYSMGIRQKVAGYFSHEVDKAGMSGIRIDFSMIVESKHSTNYSEQLASSQYCGVFPGDGFSARMEDSILHGCIPVVIQDGIQMAFENVLDQSQFSVRLQESDIPYLAEKLRAIPFERTRAMQKMVSKVASRWFYKTVIMLEMERQRRLGKREPDWVQGLRDWEGDDAMDTLIQALAYKLENDPWRRNLPSQRKDICSILRRRQHS